MVKKPIKLVILPKIGNFTLTLEPEMLQSCKADQRLKRLRF